MKHFLRKILREQEESQYYKMTPQEYLDLMKLSGYHGSVTRLKRFEGKPIWITGPLNISNTPTDSLGNVARIEGGLDISRTNISDISGIEIKGHVWDSDTPIERKRIAAELRRKREEAAERRAEGEWDLENTDEEGLRANALFQWLLVEGEIEELSEEEKERLNQLKITLQNKEEEQENLSTDIDDYSEKFDEIQEEIDEIEEEIQELESNNNDVYVISPERGSFYGLSQFEVIGIIGLRNHTYTVGTEQEMDDAALVYAKNYIDDVGVEGFREYFIENYIDKSSLEDFVREDYEYDVWQNPEVYFSDDDFELTEEQEKRIEELESYIESLEEYIERMEEEQNDLEDEIEDPDEYSQRYDEIQKMIDDAESKKETAQDEIDSIEPDTEPTQEMVDRVVDSQVDEALNNPLQYIKNRDLNIKDFIDEDELAEGLISEDGYGIMNGYDGTYDSIYLDNESYYIMRVN
jgi:Mg2+ and Co2+ transporter CorA